MCRDLLVSETLPVMLLNGKYWCLCRTSLTSMPGQCPEEAWSGMTWLNHQIYPELDSSLFWLAFSKPQVHHGWWMWLVHVLLLVKTRLGNFLLKIPVRALLRLWRSNLSANGANFHCHSPFPLFLLSYHLVFWFIEKCCPSFWKTVTTSHPRDDLEHTQSCSVLVKLVQITINFAFWRACLLT